MEIYFRIKSMIKLYKNYIIWLKKIIWRLFKMDFRYGMYSNKKVKIFLHRKDYQRKWRL